MLVEAAAGGVGTLLVQLSVSAGAVVSPRPAASARSSSRATLGAERAVDYTEPALAASGSAQVDVVFDGVGGEIAAAAFELLAPRRADGELRPGERRLGARLRGRRR